MKQRRKIFEGFTLVELVITSLVLAVLAFVAVPAYQTVIRQAKNATVRASLGEMRAAIQAYSAAEIAAGRASRFAQGAGGGWPTIEQVDDIKYSTSTLPKVLRDGDVPENPFARNVFGRDMDRVLEVGYGGLGSNAFAWQFEKGAAYADEPPLDCGRNCGGGGGGGPPPTPGGWNYNAQTGQIWARTNTNGENMY